MDRRKVISSFPFWLALLAGLYFVILSITGFDLVYFPGDFGDGRFNMYILEHAHRWFTGMEESFWNAPFMYPEPEVITYSDNLLGTAPFYSFLRILGSDRELAFQLWFVLVSVLNYSAAYFFLRWLTENKSAAALGAFIFAFSLALFSQVSHAQTFTRFPVPLAIWTAMLFVKEFNPRWIFSTILLVAYQLYCGIYLGFMLAIPVGLICLTGAGINFGVLKGRMKSINWWGRIAGSALAGVLFLYPLMKPYKDRADQLGLKPYSEIFGSLPEIKSWFFSIGETLFWNPLSDIGTDLPAWWDHQIFPGLFSWIGFLCLIVVAARQISKRQFTGKTFNVILLAVSGFLTFILFLRAGDFSFYKILYHIPGFGSMRALQRIVNIEIIFFAAGFALFLNWLFIRIRVQPFMQIILILPLLVADNYSSLYYRRTVEEADERIADMILELRGLPPGTVVSYEPQPLDDDPNLVQIDAMMSTQSLGLKTLNGYSATSPYMYSDFWLNPSPATRQQWLDHHGFKGRVVVLK